MPNNIVDNIDRNNVAPTTLLHPAFNSFCFLAVYYNSESDQFSSDCRGADFHRVGGVSGGGCARLCSSSATAAVSDLVVSHTKLSLTVSNLISSNQVYYNNNVQYARQL